VHDSGQVVTDRIQIHGVLQPRREPGHHLVRVIPGPVEPAVHCPLHPPPHRVEQRRGSQRGSGHRHYSVAGHPHLSAAGRKARAELEDSGVKVPRERRVAVLGTSGIGEPGLRDIFETPDPPPGGKLLPKTRTTAGTYSDVPPDTYLPMQPGISGRW
jgi:hypothetical protein